MAKLVPAKNVEECKMLASMGALYYADEAGRYALSSWNKLPNMLWRDFTVCDGYGMLVEGDDGDD